MIGFGGKYKKTFNLDKSKLEADGKRVTDRKYRLEWRDGENYIALIVDETMTIMNDMRG